jgi:hypothetical protein
MRFLVRGRVVPIGFPLAQIPGFDPLQESVQVEGAPAATRPRYEAQTLAQVKRDDQPGQGDQTQEPQVACTPMSNFLMHCAFVYLATTEGE